MPSASNICLGGLMGRLFDQVSRASFMSNCTSGTPSCPAFQISQKGVRVVMARSRALRNQRATICLRQFSVLTAGLDGGTSTLG
jgi:hypothetical protein